METEHACAVQALAGETRQVLNTVKPKITKFCMLSERNTGSNWVSSLLKVGLSCKSCVHPVQTQPSTRVQPSVRNLNLAGICVDVGHVIAVQDIV